MDYRKLERRLERKSRKALRAIRQQHEQQAASASDPKEAAHWLLRAIGGGPTKAGVNVSHYNAITMPAVWACVTLIADTLAQLPVDVFQRVGRRKEERPDHPVAQLFSGQPNARMNAPTYIGTKQGHVLGWGNGYSEIQRNGRGQAVALWPLLPDRTAPDHAWLNERGLLRYQVTVNGEQIRLPADDVLHVKGYSWDGVVGMSPITAARNAIGLGMAMEEFGSKFFANDAKSGGFLQHPGKLSTKAQENLRDSLSEEGKGLEEAHRIRILEEGMKFVPTTVSPEDSQFLLSREFQVAEIARMYRVPLVLINSHQRDTAWGTGIEQLMIGFIQWTIAPWVKCWEAEINRKLLTESERQAGYFVKFNLNALMRGDMAARAAFYEKALDPETGWMVRNEVREKEDLNPDDQDNGRQPMEAETDVA